MLPRSIMRKGWLPAGSWGEPEDISRDVDCGVKCCCGVGVVSVVLVHLSSPMTQRGFADASAVVRSIQMIKATEQG